MSFLPWDVLSSANDVRSAMVALPSRCLWSRTRIPTVAAIRVEHELACLSSMLNL